MLAIVCSVGLLACGGGVSGAVESWSKAACACEDKECAEKQKVEFDKLEDKFRKDLKSMSKDEKKKINKIYREGAKCLKDKFDVRAG